MNIVIDGSGKVIMWSATGSPTPEDGQSSASLNATQTAAFHALRGTPNSGITFIAGVLASLPAAAPPPSLTPTQKLAAAGLSVADLKQLLGLS